MSSKNLVEVEIFHKNFTLFSEQEGQAHLKELASFVDQRMKEIYSKTKLSSGLKIAILTALNLAEELYLEKKNKNDSSPESVNQILELVKRMEALLPESGENA